MEIRYFDKLDSTQTYLVSIIKENKLKSNLAIVAKEQTAGIGSRGNSWNSNKGDLTFSFAIKVDQLPKDLPISSASIFFAFIFKELLHKNGIDCWLKWPNDIYLKNKKVGGVITQLVSGYFVVGIGLNFTKKSVEYAYLDLELNVNKMLTSYFMLLKNYKNWQEIFSKFKVEFEKQKSFSVHIKGVKTTLSNATLCSDGALLINGERIYSLR